MIKGTRYSQRKLSEKCYQNNKHTTSDNRAWALAEGGGVARVGACSPRKPKQNFSIWGPFCNFFLLMGGPFLRVGGLLATFSPYGGHFVLIGGGGGFLGLARPNETFCGHPCNQALQECHSSHT